MNKSLFAITTLLILGLVSWGAAQGTSPVDLVKSRQEMEIMRGILKTTLEFVVQDLAQRETSGKPETSRRHAYWSGSSDIGSFFLQGQGAVFVISASGLRLRMSDRGEYALLADEARLDAEENLRDAMEAQQEALRAMSEAGFAVGRAAVPAPPVPPVPPTPPNPAVAPSTPLPAAQSTGKQEDMKKRLFEAQEKVRQRREEMEAEQKKLMEYLGVIKGHLVEAIANYGDSMTTVKSGEYINVIIDVDRFGGGRIFLGGNADQPTYQIITVPKSLITDYKAGKLNLEALKQRVQEYQY
jgi:hypothetical protein